MVATLLTMHLPKQMQLAGMYPEYMFYLTATTNNSKIYNTFCIARKFINNNGNDFVPYSLVLFDLEATGGFQFVATRSKHMIN